MAVKPSKLTLFTQCFKSLNKTAYIFGYIVDLIK